MPKPTVKNPNVNGSTLDHKARAELDESPVADEPVSKAVVDTCADEVMVDGSALRVSSELLEVDLIDCSSDMADVESGFGDSVCVGVSSKDVFPARLSRLVASAGVGSVRVLERSSKYFDAASASVVSTLKTVVAVVLLDVTMEAWILTETVQ